MALGLPNATRTAKATAVKDLCAGGTLQLRSGVAPGPNDSNSGTLIATFTLASPAFGTVTNGSMSLAGVPISATAVAADTGATKHFRIFASGGAHVLQGSVTESGGGGDAIIGNANVAVDQVINLTGLTYNQPGS